MTGDERIEHCKDALKTAHECFETVRMGGFSPEDNLAKLAEGLSTLTGLGIFMIKEAEKDNEL